MGVCIGVWSPCSLTLVPTPNRMFPGVSDHINAHGGCHRGHAEEDPGASLRHPPGPLRRQDAADGAARLCGHHGQPGNLTLLSNNHLVIHLMDNDG